MVVLKCNVGHCRSALSLLNLPEEELLQPFIRESEQGRFFQRLVRVPTVDDRAFHEPHPGGSSAASSMDERRLDSWRGDRLQERVDDRWIRRSRAERDVVIGNPCRFRRSGALLDVSPRLGCETEV